MTRPPLPVGWCDAALTDVVELNPRTPEVVPGDDQLVSFVPMAAVEAMTGRMDASATRSWRDVKKGYTRFQEGDVLFAKITPCMENGKAAVARGLHGKIGAGSTEFHTLRPCEALDPDLLLYYLLQTDFRKTARARMTGTAGQLRVPSRFLEESKLPLPPVEEQHRIVEAIDSYFSRLDDAVANLERVQRNLERYRASVLKAAVEGRLVPTEAELARAEGREYEPASVLRERVLGERRRRWEEIELAKMKAKKRVPENDKWKEKYKAPAAPTTVDAPALPDGWCWTTIDQVATEVRYGSSAKAGRSAYGVPVLRMGNLVGGLLDFTDLKYLPQDHAEFPDLLLTPGDLLFNRTNSAELVGKTAVFHGHNGPCSFASYLIRVRLAPGVEADYVSHFINSLRGRRWIASVVSQQVGQANVNGTKLRACALPLPPTGEQRRIVEEISRLMSMAASVREGGEMGRWRGERLRQSILQWAFKGKLVDQDPNDEPASALLERIQGERGATEPKKRCRRARRTARTC